jgi:MipA family protein
MRVRLTLALATLGVASPIAAQAPAPPMLAGQVGVLVLALPRYPGSDRRWVLPVPFVDLRLARRVYVGDGLGGVSAGAGVYLVETGGFSWTADLALTQDRPEDRSGALAGMGDRGFGVFGGSTMAYRAGPAELSAAVALGLEDRMGLLGVLGLTVGGTLGGRWYGQAGTALVFGDCANLEWDFGVTERQARRRQALIAAGTPGLEPGDGTPYRPECGLRDVRATAALGYALTRRLSLLGTGALTRLEGGAATSPLTRERTSWEAGAGLAWRF